MSNISFSSAVIFQLEIHRKLFEYDIQLLDEHIIDVERDLNRRRKSLEQSLTRDANNLSEQQKEELGDLYSDEFRKVDELLPTIHRRSYLLTILSEFENYLNRLSARAVCVSSASTNHVCGVLPTAVKQALLKVVPLERFRRRVNIVHPVHLFRLLDRGNVEVHDHRLLAAADEHA